MDFQRGGRSLSTFKREVAPWVERLARMGYVAKALLYITVGLVAAKAAVGPGGRATDARGALRIVQRNVG